MYVIILPFFESRAVSIKLILLLFLLNLYKQFCNNCALVAQKMLLIKKTSEKLVRSLSRPELVNETHLPDLDHVMMRIN